MYRFHNQKVDTGLFLQLQDLTTVLSRHAKLSFSFQNGAIIDLVHQQVSASRFWDHTAEDDRPYGYKTDIYLRTLGTLYFTSVPAFNDFRARATTTTLENFALQLVTLFEDIRLEEIIKRIRPGTKKAFQIRKKQLLHHFSHQLTANVTRSYETDELFCLIYLLLQADRPDPDFPQANAKQLHYLNAVKSLVFSVFDANTTSEVTNITEAIVQKLNTHYTDSKNIYFPFPIANIEHYTRNTLFDELTRTDALNNDDIEQVDEDKSDYFDEAFSTWHRENKNSTGKQNFLQFELEQGTKTSLMGGGARETEDGDQAFAAIQGASGKAKQQDYSKMETLEKKENTDEDSIQASIFGNENKYAVIRNKPSIQPSLQDKRVYEAYVEAISIYKKKLAKTLEATLEHKQTMPRNDLHYGRLAKNLLPIVTDKHPRIFYKKEQPAKELDAVFSLLVDCSASMHTKMAETKKGITLFHEVLKHLKIKHAITGFWEDASEGTDSIQPNYFHQIHSFTDSLYRENGPKIMQLEAEEDNRDGFSIRVATKELETRTEKNKFIIVFTDGEPAAANYHENGIVDTNKAVYEARKKGIEVIGIFLADGEIQENDDQMMQNIYGRERLMIPNITELPAYFTPLLKKLVLKTM
ncbi:VWA domain-containing protein [Virgibacillus sp. LDC-1]|uniref:vWA domain-containing protein n=1 Tax=Virgibacillus sp. LDC-1 TaxID=3039856 RepID=UPI0024DE94C4|nr:VWA domain-containing protein [Virgibacillus sp. LDC-1]